MTVEKRQRRSFPEDFKREAVALTVHHSVSSLCFAHPHLGVACKQTNICSIQEVITNDSKIIEHAVDSIGVTAKILNEDC